MEADIEAECTNGVEANNFRISSLQATNLFMDYKGEEEEQTIKNRITCVKSNVYI